MTIQAFCYNEGRVYLDGEDVGQSNARDLIRYRSEHPRLLAVECANTRGVDGGVLVSISDRTVTNGSWKVETTQYSDWMKLTYKEADNSNWNAPHVLGTNAEKPNIMVGHTERGTVTMLRGCGRQQTLALTRRRTFEETWASILPFARYFGTSCCKSCDKRFSCCSRSTCMNYIVIYF